jgi:NAD(P)H dehydrogenase (quinone)
MIVVTAATGKLGRLVVEASLKKVPANEIAVAVRSPEKAADFAAKGIHVRQADYENQASLEKAFAGADKVLLISGSEVGKRLPQHRAAVNAAKKAGVKLIAYTGILHADRSPLALTPEHKATEEVIRASGIPFVFLRNGWYTENYTEHFAAAFAHNALVGSAGNGKIAAATRRDYAEAAAVVLTTTGHENKIYELAGAPFTMSELASELSKQSGKSIAYNNLPADQYLQILLGAGLPKPYAEILVDADLGIAKGELDDSSGDLARLIARPTTPLADAVKSALAKS